MASSSSSNPSSRSPKNYDVFISFRGEDTRFNFISHLHKALCRDKIETYVDYKLEKGDEVWPSLEKAIEDSTMFLVILSENYAYSTWCLKELTKVLECSKNQGHLIMPVFYRVDPSHVRKQSGSYQKAFDEHEHKSINKQQAQKWREALTHAANLSGWHCSFDRNEAELITEIVKSIIQKLGWVYQSEENPKDFIGIDKRTQDVESLLYKGSNDVQFIGIWAMGGMGKTTLAKALFNKLRFAYEGFCFMSNVREESKKYGIVALKKQLILTLLGNKESRIGMIDEITPYDMRRLGRKKVFIVLDDVDDNAQLENLARRNEFGSSSKILITTRDKQVLGKEVDDIYVLEALNPDHAFDLFSINAFRNDYVDPKTIGLAEKFTQYAEGNPLALKVLGSLLYGKNQEAWKSQLEKLKKLPYPKINDILKLSFEGLDCEEREIFLDIACFFKGHYFKDVKCFLDAFGYSTYIALERLKDKALLDIYERRISMHHLIQEMGRQIVREESLNDPKKRSRLWNSNEISKILKENMGSEAINSISLNVSEVEEMCLSPQVFCPMPNLKFLNLHKNLNDQVGNKLKFPCGIEFLPNKLRLLLWVECPLKSLPAVENIVQITMPYSNLTKLWDGIQNLVNLRKIELAGSKDLIELPNFSKAIHLAKVNLSYCSELRRVDPSILSLNSLCCLRLRGCKALTSLTSNVHLKSLRQLDSAECSRLNKFSVTSENCAFHLDLSGTAINDELCSSSGNLSKIDSLFLDGCKSVTSLHKLVDLRSLTRLDANGCNKLASNLRSIIDEACALEVLKLEDCSDLFELPNNINMLSSLRMLYLPRTNIETLPLSIKYLCSLEILHLNGCERLRSLPELPPSLAALSIKNCLSIEILNIPLTSKDEEGIKVSYDFDDNGRAYPYFNFTNCMKLDRQSIEVAEAKVLLGQNKGLYGSFYLEYPGERVPEWFMHKTTQSSVTVDLNSIPQPWDDCFIFCVVISADSAPRTHLRVEWNVGNCFLTTFRDIRNELTLSDHAFIWYNNGPSLFEIFQRELEVKKAYAQSNIYHSMPLKIEFSLELCEAPGYGRTGEIKACGVCPTSAVEYQSYIQQIKLALHNPHPNSIAMEAPSRKRKYHSLLR